MSEEALKAKARGNEAFKAGKYDDAINEFSQAIKLSPNESVFYSNRSMCYATKGDYENALNDGKKCIELKPNWAKAYSRAGVALFKMGRYDEAKDIYEDGLEKCNNDQSLQTALDSTIQAINQQRTNPFGNLFGPDMWTKLAANPQTRDLLNDQAIVAKLTSLQQNPNNINLYLQDPQMMPIIGALLGIPMQAGPMPTDNNVETTSSSSSSSQQQSNNETKTKEPEPEPEPEPELTEEEKKAKELEEKALNEKELGNQLFKKKDFDEAMKHYNNAVELVPNNIVFRSNRAAVYFQKGEYDKCISECEEAYKIGREHMADYKALGKLLVRQGNAYIKLGQEEKAIEILEKSLVESNEYKVRQLVKKLKTKLEEKKKLEYINPELSEQHKQNGNKLVGEGKFPDAIKEYDEAMRRDPNNFKALSNRAHCYTKLMDWNSALRDCDQCLKLQPNFVKAYVRKGKIQLFLKQYHKALETVRMAASIEPNNADVAALSQEVQMAISMNSNDNDPQRAQEAMKDPEVQAILTDPVMQQVLKDLKENPAAAQAAMADPGIQKKLEVLIASGILRVGQQ